MQAIFIAAQNGYESSPKAFSSLSAATTYVMKQVFGNRAEDAPEEFPRVKMMLDHEDFAQVYTPEEFAEEMPLWSFIGDWQIKRVWLDKEV